MDAIIRTDQLTKMYGELAAVRDLSLNIKKGEVYGFLGLNGAGKTTTIRMILGMIRQSSGESYLFGEKVTPGAKDLWSRVGYLVEMPYAYPQLTVKENLEMARRLYLLDDSTAVGRIIEKMGLTGQAIKKASNLSLGNRQRLGLARAMIHEPDLLILDEPANGLDPAGVVEVRELLVNLAREQGVTVFMSSHILGEVARIATRIGVIHQGRLIEEFSQDELEKRRKKWLLVDAWNRGEAKAVLEARGFGVELDAREGFKIFDPHAIEHPDQIARILTEADVPPIKLIVDEEDLEHYFLRLVGMQRAEEQ